jgi:hypothetical protein
VLGSLAQTFSLEKTMRRISPIFFALLLITPMLVGCQGGRGPILTVLLGPLADEQLAKELSKEVYPADAPKGDDLDVVVKREGTKIVLANRTARNYESSQLWLNQQYVGQVDLIVIGAGDKFNRYALADFINEFGEGYPVGGFLNPGRTYPIVLAELYDPTGDKKRHRLSIRFDQK